ncbi:MAG: M48 family metalloprotease [Alphaproteobacteria bacterium]|nr:M48 family metalloprotease [Alphaproteobacteria bacterium]
MKHIQKLFRLLMGAAIGISAGGVAPSSAQFITKSQESAIGAEEHPKIIKQYGGVYDEAQVSGYVAAVGGRIVANSEIPGVPFHFTVLDSPIVNAFALPGGYVYVTRGLIALANSEAELASVLAHEVGHVAARHTAQRYNRSVGMSLGGAILGALIGNQIVNNLVQQGGQLYLLSYSRDQEYEADQLGVRYLVRAGYDPYAEADFLQSMEAHDALESALNRDKNNSPGEFLSSHPRTAKRVVEAIDSARQSGVPVRTRPRLRDEFLNSIDGMVYGDSSEHGFVRDRNFIHPKMRFAFTVPPGFKITNAPDAVVAQGPDEIKIKFDMAPLKSAMSMPVYLTSVWANDVRLRNPEGLVINGMQAATAETTIATRSGNASIRLIAIGFAPDTVARIMILTPNQPGAQMRAELQRFTYSFRALSPQEASKIRPLHIKPIPVKSGDSIAGMAQRMPFSDYREPRFRVLNGLREKDNLSPGMRVKIITE